MDNHDLLHSRQRLLRTHFRLISLQGVLGLTLFLTAALGGLPTNPVWSALLGIAVLAGVAGEQAVLKRKSQLWQQELQRQEALAQDLLASQTRERAQHREAARARGGRVVAVGTTTLRTLESAALAGKLQAGEAETELFILPGFNFRVVDILISNFHLPKSTLLMLVSAFGGLENLRRAYRHAIAEGYRFFSYGDAMLINRLEPVVAQGATPDTCASEAGAGR